MVTSSLKISTARGFHAPSIPPRQAVIRPRASSACESTSGTAAIKRPVPIAIPASMLRIISGVISIVCLLLKKRNYREERFRSGQIHRVRIGHSGEVIDNDRGDIGCTFLYVVLRLAQLRGKVHLVLYGRLSINRLAGTVPSARTNGVGGLDFSSRHPHGDRRNVYFGHILLLSIDVRGFAVDGAARSVRCARAAVKRSWAQEIPEQTAGWITLMTATAGETQYSIRIQCS